MKKIIKIISNPKVFVYTVIWLIVLIVLGTLAQRNIGLYASQNKYFSSYSTWLGDILPLPGGRTTMIVIMVNLMSMLFKYNIWKLKKIGIIIVHLGAVLLLFGAGVTAIFSSEGNMVIDEGARSNYVDDYHDMELAIINTSKGDLDEYTVFDQPLLKIGNKLSHENLDFEIEIMEYYNNCTVRRRTEPADIQYKGMIKNFDLIDLNLEKVNTDNRPGIIYKIENFDEIYGLIFGQSVIQTVTINNLLFKFVFRKKRNYLPFAIELLDFKKILHPGTEIAKSYSSEINLIENGVSRKVLIQMNEPLRHRGYTFFQSSFIDAPEGESTVLAVVKNYGRLFPYISSIIMAIGLFVHLCINLPNLLRRSKVEYKK